MSVSFLNRKAFLFTTFARMDSSTREACLRSSAQFDFETEAFQAFFRSSGITGTTKEDLIRWYGFVRDYFLYDPYHLDLRPEALTASVIVAKRRAWCVEKALVFATGCRFMGFPARLGFGIVQNHIGVEKLEHYLGRKEIVFHGYADVFVDGNWVKCTPAFDRRICAVNRLEPLEWDAEHHSLFQAFSGDQQFMEYLHFYGEFEDIPFPLMHAEMKRHYPHLFSDPVDTKAFSFHFDQELADRF